MLSKHIVVIDDDEDLLNIQQEVLVHAGYRVTAIHHIQSLDALLNLDADCFIIDEQMPVISGHIVCIYLRSKPAVVHVPVVLISSHPKLDHYSELCGADVCLAKPFNLQKLLATVERLLN